MATFTGTSNADFFAGADAVADTFRFVPENLTFVDFISGGDGSNANDTLQLLGPGVLDQDDLDQVFRIERIVVNGSTTLDIPLDMFLTARNGTISVFGSDQNDVLFGDASAGEGLLVFEPGAGSDIFIGTAGNDIVRIDAADVDGRDIFNAGLGNDALTFTTGGSVGQLANFFGFERVNLHAGGNQIVLTQGMVGSVDVDQFRVFGGAANDSVDARAVTSNVSLNGGGGTNFFDGGSGNDRATGGADADTFFGGEGNDTLFGMGGADTLDGGKGDNFIDGGEGDDQMAAGLGKTTFVGGLGDDDIFVESGDTKMDYIRYRASAEGGDSIFGLSVFLTADDLGFQFLKSGPDAFSTVGNNFNKIVQVSSPSSDRFLIADADVVLFNDGGAGRQSAESVDALFLSFFAVAGAGAFLMNYDNTSGKASLYYDSDAFNEGGVVLLAEIDGWSAESFALLDRDNFAFV